MKIKREILELIRLFVNRILPDKMPYSVGIHQDIFESMHGLIHVDDKILMMAIRICLFQKCRSYKYMQAMSVSKWRYGLGNKRTLLDDEHRKRAKVFCKELRRKRRIYEKAIQRAKR